MDENQSTESGSGHNLAAFAHGGAIYVSDGSPTIENCKILENYVHLGHGGGLYATGISQPIIRDSEFSRNVAIHGGSGGQGQGAGISLWTDLPNLIERCTFDQNLAKHFYAVGGLEAARGGGLFNFLSPIELINCSFTRNQANQGGGFATFAEATLVNCQFTDNKAVAQPNDPYPELGGDGAGLSSQSFPAAVVTLINCTIAGNDAKKYAGASAWGGMTLDVRNCVIWGNTASDPEFIGFWESQLTKALGTLDYSCIQFILGPPKLGEDPLEPKKRPGCVESDPLFEPGVFALSVNSPCIDAGRNSSVPVSIVTDLMGMPRFVDNPDTPDTGIGTPPLVDMGALEYQVGVCYADCDGNGALDFFDFLCFQNAFVSGTAYADCDASGTLDFFDFLCFQNEFAGGCK